MKVETEIWEVETHDGIYQADLPTLKQWVAERLVLPTDKVRKGSFKWIEAGNAPLLRPVFSGEERVEVVATTPQAEPAHAAATHVHVAVPPGTSPPQERAPDLGLAGDEPQAVYAATPAVPAAPPAPPAPPAPEVTGAPHGAEDAATQDWGDPYLSGAPGLSSACHFHPLQAATLFCRSCNTTFCRACPNRVGSSSVQLCPLCGGFCDPLETLTERLELYQRQSEGFGVEDFLTALAYPFRHLASLLGGALLYGLLLLLGLRTQILAYALVYGCISLVVRRVAYGDLKRDFMPDFSEFSAWDDIVVPCALGLGVTVVTLGPTLILVGMLLFGWANTKPQPQVLPTVGPAAEGRGATDGPRAIPQDGAFVIEGGTPEQREELAKKLRAASPSGQVASQMQEAKLGDDSAVVYVCRLLLAHPGLAVLLGLFAFGWALFYYPMALLVAGWTESLKSVLNPLVGLDTIRHMGPIYFKAFFMYLCVQVMAAVMHGVVTILTFPFNLPIFGNLPGTFLSGIVTFYVSLVIACLLGLSLFKSADRLNIDID